MAGHTSEKRWRAGMNPTEPRRTLGVSEQVSTLCVQVLSALTAARAAFLEMQEIYNYTGSTVQGLADQLFFEDWSTRLVDPQVPDVYETQANAEEVSKAQDAFDAITAMHELHQCADNVAISAEDRYAQLRRMS